MNKFILLFLLIIVSSCKEELTIEQESLNQCRELIEFTCSEITSNSFFSGTMNGIDFCVSDGSDGYSQFNVISRSFTTNTDGGSKSEELSGFNFGFSPPAVASIEPLKPDVSILTPMVKGAALKPHEYIDRFVKMGDLELRDKNKDRTSGFTFYIWWGCEFSDEENRLEYISTSLSTTNSTLSDNTVFKVVNLKKETLPDFHFYDITFEIECDLYWADIEGEKKKFGRLENGVFKTEVLVPR